ncbi:hypothetical protein BD770DRAFT_408005 [Pilaira anomala]|nr:hypothetical protein BD770DRAFT_408005 [Pilaira anomala]
MKKICFSIFMLPAYLRDLRLITCIWPNVLLSPQLVTVVVEGKPRVRVYEGTNTVTTATTTVVSTVTKFSTKMSYLYANTASVDVSSVISKLQNRYSSLINESH